MATYDKVSAIPPLPTVVVSTRDGLPAGWRADRPAQPGRPPPTRFVVRAAGDGWQEELDDVFDDFGDAVAHAATLAAARRPHWLDRLLGGAVDPLPAGAKSVSVFHPTPAGGVHGYLEVARFATAGAVKGGR